MKDMHKYWENIRHFQKKQRWDNYARNKKVLDDNGIHCVEKANGYFIIYDTNNKPIFDFWATTGLFIERTAKLRKRGNGAKDLVLLLDNH